MNAYIQLINQAIDFIEDNLSRPVTAQGISSQFYVSEFHFNRLFKAAVGKTLKQYILSRKLNHALELLGSTDRSIIDIACNLGFEYPEVFSRAFKKQYGLPPYAVRAQKSRFHPVQKAAVIPRQLVNTQGAVAIKAAFVQRELLALAGVGLEVNLEHPEFESHLRSASDAFLRDYAGHPGLKHDIFYNTVACHGDGSSNYSVFLGKEAGGGDLGELQRRTVPAGWYAHFLYTGDMLDIRSTFVDDLYRWVILREVELSSCGLGMLCIFDQSYMTERIAHILIPVQSPKSQQERS